MNKLQWYKLSLLQHLAVTFNLGAWSCFGKFRENLEINTPKLPRLFCRH